LFTGCKKPGLRLMKGLGILCSGQGDQFPEMFGLFDGVESAQYLLRTGSERLWGHSEAFLEVSSSEWAFDNIHAQPLICLRQLTAWQVLAAQLPRPRVLAGYSLGEFVAYGCAGALPAEEMLKLASRRAEIMDAVASQSPAGLTALRGLTSRQVEQLCKSTGAEIAIINGPDHFVVGGTDSVLARLQELAEAAGAQKVQRLQVSVPSHTALMAAAGTAFRKELAAASWRSHVAPPVVAGISGAMIRNAETAVDALADQICQPIRWDLCQQAALEMGCDVFLELGPGSALSRMMRDSFPGIQIRSVDEFRSLSGAADWVLKQCGRQ